MFFFSSKGFKGVLVVTSSYILRVREMWKCPPSARQMSLRNRERQTGRSVNLHFYITYTMSEMVTRRWKKSWRCTFLFNSVLPHSIQHDLESSTLLWNLPLQSMKRSTLDNKSPCFYSLSAIMKAFTSTYNWVGSAVQVVLKGFWLT